jgi:hypothetical protein
MNAVLVVSKFAVRAEGSTFSVLVWSLQFGQKEITFSVLVWSLQFGQKEAPSPF